MDVTYSIILVNTGGIRENNRRDLVIKYCKVLGMDISILKETHLTSPTDMKLGKPGMERS